MFIRSKGQVPVRERSGLVSHFLLSRGEVAGDALAITWVEVGPGSRQRRHQHPEVQVYIIIAGRGVMQVGDDRQPVQAGDLIFIPSDRPHGIDNTGADPLCYVSAATPAFDLAAAYDHGQLRPAADTPGG
jgi:mannose-6-phosphate isomerase-like protein (cupin superfamily)